VAALADKQPPRLRDTGADRQRLGLGRPLRVVLGDSARILS
jgi:hypothetical protein